MATHACTYRVLFSLHHPVPDLCADQKLIAGELWAPLYPSQYPSPIHLRPYALSACLQGDTDEEDAGPASEPV